jgi:hypothetical protein
LIVNRPGNLPKITDLLSAKTGCRKSTQDKSDVLLFAIFIN